MEKYICPRCGSTNIDWIIPQVWSKWLCKDCSYLGPVIKGDDDLANEIREDWELNKEEFLKKSYKKFKQSNSNSLDNDIDDISEFDDDITSEEDLTEEEIDRRLRKLNL